MADPPPPQILNKKLLLVNSVGSVVVKLLNVAVMIWTAQYLLNRIRPDEYELLPILMSIMMFIPLAASVMTSGIGRFVVEADAKGDTDRVTQITSTMFVVCLAGSALLALPLAGLVVFVDRVLDIPPDRVGEAQLMLGLLLGVFFLRLPAAPFSTGLYARQRFVAIGLVEMLSTLVRTALLLVLLLGVSPKVLWVVVALVVSQLISTAVGVALSNRAMPAQRFRPGSVNWTLFRPITAFGFWNATGQLAHSIRQSADPLILNKLSVPIEVNAMYVGSLIDRNLQMLMGQATRPLEPILIGLHAMDQPDRLRNVTVRVTRANLWLVMLPYTLLMILSEPIMRLYLGEAFETYPTSAIVLLVLAAVRPFGTCVMFVPKLSMAKNKLGPFTRLALLQQVANLALTLVLVGPVALGSIGAALSTFVVAVAWLPLFWLPMLSRLTGMSIGRILREAVLPGMTPTALSGCLLLAGRTAFDLGDGPVALAWQSALLAVVYLGITRALFSPADKADWQKIVGRLKRKAAG